MTKRYDAVIVGGGHNGLVCAFYLARAGYSVRILERRSIVGGAAVTEEFAPGFRNSTASYTVSLLNPKVIADMALADHGYRVIERPISNFLPQPNGGYLKLGGSLERTQSEFARFSTRDAAALPAYYDALETVADVLREMVLKAPPNVGEGMATILDAIQQGRRLAGLSIEQQRDVLDLFTKSARTFLDSWFENEAVKATFGFDAVVGNFASPDTPGSAYVLLHHVFGEVNGKKGTWGHSVGGMGAITQIMAKIVTAMGVEISLDAPVSRILVDGDRAVGARIESGEEVIGSTVIANVGPKLLYERLIDTADVPADFLRRIRAFKAGSGTFRMNVALSTLPDFTCLPGAGEHHQSGIIIAPTLDYMDQAYLDAKQHGIAKKPIVEMLIPSTIDDSLAPPGAHVASLFCQQFASELPGGRNWDDEREAAADLILQTVEDYAPGFKASVIARQIHSPLDLERKFGLVDGDIMHGNMSLDQLWAARPVLGHGSYRGPLKGLYMCGAGTHPGGGVTGAPGHNAARAVLADRSLIGRMRGRG
ncbi:NAD(P)/FAD-dependent oxidoreductase [Sphingobium aromaticiconvertens]|uniref:phytoene desaturase family protein n=1 Tax=Sphingobium aromaticiconvertens TaxID=365341 RepID=UPI003017DC04